MARKCVVGVLNSYEDAWNDYRRRRRFALASVAGVPTYVLAFSALPSHLGSWFSIIVIMGLWILVLLSLGVSLWRLSSWRCPRCKQEYFMRNRTHNPFARQCRHCGLRKWALDPESVSA